MVFHWRCFMHVTMETIIQAKNWSYTRLKIKTPILGMSKQKGIIIIIIKAPLYHWFYKMKDRDYVIDKLNV